jgi:hypothetical protein
MRAVLIAAALIAVPLASLAAPAVERIDVLDAGTYTVETGEATADPTVPLGETVAVTKATLVTAGTTLPATLGTEFGFRYVAIGAPVGDKVPLDFVITYPAPGLADPGADAPVGSARFTREKTIGTPDYLGYLLEAPWEAVPGAWHFEIWHDGQKLAEQTFTLTAPP